ncbi:MAG: hypothetical protein IKM00_05205 [Clostridia bacterium]|nr:hypothetical protein [Clostridia bacterium]
MSAWSVPLFFVALAIFALGYILREKIPPALAAAMIVIGVLGAMAFLNISLFSFL